MLLINREKAHRDFLGIKRQCLERIPIGILLKIITLVITRKKDTRNVVQQQLNILSTDCIFSRAPLNL